MTISFSNTKNEGKNVNILCYGRAGVGKTVLCSTAPKPVIISTESGLLSLVKYDIPVIKVSSLQDLNDAYDIVVDKTKFKTICLDSISDIAEAALTKLKKEKRDPRQAYGVLSDKMSELIRMFRDLDRNVYFIATAETYETAAGIQGIRPAMPGKRLTAALPYFFDEVFCLRMGQEDENQPLKRYLQTEPTLTVEAKDRSGKLKAKEKPNLTKIFKKLMR